LLSIQKYLIAEVAEPSSINFKVDLDIRDPFDHKDKIPVPPYLHSAQGPRRPRHIQDDITNSEEESGEEEM
jgi:hypothetical protein